MCGICGQFNFGSDQPIDPNRLRRMASTIAHRGPDDEGYYMNGSLGLGFRRLSIIDLENGRQPMTDNERSVWVVFNGEIYNFPELRSELEAHGHVFRTHCDTEVIVHGYKQWGINVLSHLNGMFGLAVWDERRKQLMLARDRLGIKPVYYKLSSDSLSFGSEIRAVLEGSGTKPVVDHLALYQFLRYRYTPAPLTIFRGIKKLAPGTRLIVSKHKQQLERWWNFKPEPFDPMPKPAEARDNLLDLYQRSVKRQLLSDVPVGLLLSGGIDSTLLLALMNQNGTGWQTFTAGYGCNFVDDELEDAAKTAGDFRARHASVRIDRESFEASLPRIIAAIEEPVASSSIVPMFHVCQRASQEVKVALMGQGPDELFGGYKRHLGVRYGKYWRDLPPWLQSPLRNVLSHFTNSDTVRRGLHSLAENSRLRRYQQVFSLLPERQLNYFFDDGALPAGSAHNDLPEYWRELEPNLRETDELGGLQYIELRSSLPDELLMYADKLSMVHGLEVRVPYLDHEIVEYVERLDATMKVRHGRGKWLHRQVSAKYLPSEVLRRKKKGFAVNVVDQWFGSSLRSGMQEMLFDNASLMYRYLRPAAVQRLATTHERGDEDNHKILFSLAAFEMWHRNFLSD